MLVNEENEAAAKDERMGTAEREYDRIRQEAIKIVSILLNEPEKVEKYATAASMCIKMGLADEGERIARQGVDVCRSIVNRNAATAEVYEAMGQCLETIGSTREAVYAFVKAAQKDTRRASAWLSLGIALLEDGKPGDAAYALKEALEREPENVLAMRFLVMAYSNAGMHKEVVHACRKMMKIGTEERDILVIMANSAHEAEMHQDAVMACTMALGMPGEMEARVHSALHRIQAKSMMAMGMAGDAVVSAEAAVEADPTSAESLYELANMRYMVADYRGAMEVHKRLCMIDMELASTLYWMNGKQGGSVH